MLDPTITTTTTTATEVTDLHVDTPELDSPPNVPENEHITIIDTEYTNSDAYQQLTPYCRRILDTIIKRETTQIRPGFVNGGNPFHLDAQHGFLVLYQKTKKEEEEEGKDGDRGGWLSNGSDDVDKSLEISIGAITECICQCLAQVGISLVPFPSNDELQQNDCYDDYVSFEYKPLHGVINYPDGNSQPVLPASAIVNWTEFSTNTCGHVWNSIHHKLLSPSYISQRIEKLTTAHQSRVIFMPTLMFQLVDARAVHPTVRQTNETFMNYYKTHLPLVPSLMTRCFRWISGPPEMYLRITLSYFKETNDTDLDMYIRAVRQQINLV